MNEINRMRRTEHIPPTNMRQFKPPKRRRKVGDYFVFSVRPNEFYWGRLMSLDMIIGGWKKAALVYLYDAHSPTIEIRPPLSKLRLLVPPISPIARLWTKGYFLIVENEPLRPDDLFEQHCFYWNWPNVYCDGHGGKLRARIEPCGSYGLYSEMGIDGEISKSLGLPMPDYFGRNDPE